MKRTEKVLLIVFLVVSLICGKFLLDYWQDSYGNRQNYRQVEEIAFPEKDTEDDGTGSNADNPMTEIDDFDYASGRNLDGYERSPCPAVLHPVIRQFFGKSQFRLRLYIP